MAYHLLSVRILLCTCLLLTPSWFGNNGVNGRSSRPPEMVKHDGNEVCHDSPNYPDNYPNNSNITQPLSVTVGNSMEIIFEEFDVEENVYGNNVPRCQYDYVLFYDENGKRVGEELCGKSLPKKFIIPTRKASFLFRSDVSLTKKGFKFCYKPECGIENPGTRISGGSITAPNQYPWMVSLPRGCGGALITNRHVLTAKHCVDKATLNDWRGKVILVGVHNQSDSNDYETATIKDYVWPDSPNHDIAIIIVDPPVDLNDKKIGTVCLPTSASEDYIGKQATAMGWGWTPNITNPAGWSDGNYSELLQHLELTVAKEYNNWLFTKTVFNINGTVLDVCSGDSGGPLVYKEAGRGTVIATVSNGDFCPNHSGALGGWNKVTGHLEWIRSVISKTNSITEYQVDYCTSYSP